MTSKTLLLCASFLILSGAAASAGDTVSEMELFSSSETALQAAAEPTTPEEKKTLALSGEAVTAVEDAVFRNSAGRPLDTFIVGNFFLDARLKKGVKAFSNIEAAYYAREGISTATIREAFIDFNIDRRVYFRAGKQVLQWGRCYLWNPTDLVNVERKPFIPKIGYREGAYGLKVHVPFGATRNIYAFFDTGGRINDNEIAAALKYEFLVGRTEMAFSGWGRRNRRPIFGYDMSSRIGDTDVAAELAVARRDNNRYLRDTGGRLEVFRKNRGWPAQAAINFSRGFRLGDFKDRLTASTEFFYNQNGYTRALLSDDSVYNFPFALPNGAVSGTKRDFLLTEGLYAPNYFSRYYAAAFTSVSRFLITDMTLNVNYIRNLNDQSGIVSAGVTYANINDFSAGFLANAFLGRGGREYTFTGLKMLYQLTAGISF